MSGNVEIRVTVHSHIYGPTDDGYRIISGAGEDGGRVIVGGKVIPSTVEEGDEMIVVGRWKHSDRGSMIVASEARRTLPQTERGMTAWLTKAKIPGVGKVRAERLVEQFGLEAIKKVIARDPLAIKIVGKKKIEGAAENLETRSREAEIGAMLSGYGVGGSVQAKILKRYGDRTQQILLNHPYKLITEITGVAFATADRIAKSAGIANDDPGRIKAGIVERIRQASQDGHTAVHHDQLIKGVESLLYVDYELIEEQLKDLEGAALKKVDLDGLPGWSLTRIADAEERIARNVVAKLRSKAPPFPYQEVSETVLKCEEALGFTLNAKQREGAIMALTHNLAILTGGPGTGKTRTLMIILAAWRVLSQKYASELSSGIIQLLAPTGKAAKRASEVTGVEGKTIHRGLEYNPEHNGFERNKNNPIEAGLMAIDESSMPDVMITRDLTEAWGDAKTLLVGDVDQLPSVGPGSVLRDLINCGKIPTVRLEEIYRQSEGSQIALGAADVKRGRMPEMCRPGQGDLVFIDLDDPQDVAARIREMYIEKMPAYLVKKGLDPSSIQILSPGKQSDVGTLTLNRIVQEAIHGDSPQGPTVMLSDKMVGRIGDRVIQLENDYELLVFNGDTGKIVEIETDSHGAATKTYVDFGERILSFTGSSLGNLTLSYALTIHKSQGSEFQVVIIPMTGAHYSLNKRPLVYTGMTRAKKICVFVGQRKAMANALRREDAVTRVTTLARRITMKYEAMDRAPQGEADAPPAADRAQRTMVTCD